MVIGFLFALFIIRRLSTNSNLSYPHVSNLAMWSLVSGLVGARFFFVVHNFSLFQDRLLTTLYLWEGGLEFLGGVILAIIVAHAYLLWYKLPIRTYLDILAIGLMAGLIFGRIGCFLNGGCFGTPTDLQWAVQFPYGCPAYQSQAFPDPKRHRMEPYLELPAEYYGYLAQDGKTWLTANHTNKFQGYLKPYAQLTEGQRAEVQEAYPPLGVHPTQLYSSANAALLCLILCQFWKKWGYRKPGATAGLMFILYGATRFFLEGLRGDNPFEYSWWALYKGGTISQNIGIYMLLLGTISFILCMRSRKNKKGATEIVSAST